MTEKNGNNKSAKTWVVMCIILFVLLAISAVINIIHLSSSGKGNLIKNIEHAQQLISLKFTEQERQLMKDDVKENLSHYQKLREFPIKNALRPALVFDPLPHGIPVSTDTFTNHKFSLPHVDIAKTDEELAFFPVTALSYLIKSRQLTSTRLTKLYLQRLKKYGPSLNCVITLTEELAMEQAKRADEEIAAGNYRGPLHGIPWGAKDLLATKGTKTTWGAGPYKEQVFAEDATVVKRLHAAGAVLVAKLSMGALAWGDVWYKGKTRNPWNPKQGSSGSSAGSAACTSAGLVGFAIGTETWGSIVSPSARCGVTGLRPTFGRVSRYGAMALSWSMDKIGPICRSVEDCALVFSVIQGPDGNDPTVKDVPFHWNPNINLKDIRVGYLKKEFDRDAKKSPNDKRVLETLRALGVKLIPLELPTTPVNPLSFILNAEAAAAFDELTRSNRDDLLKRQVRRAWPNVFRASRLIPAVEYIQANRIRTQLIRDMIETLKEIDVYVAPTFAGNNLLLTNLTGHPAVVLPNGFDKEGNPTSITFVGNLFQETKTLVMAKAFQNATTFHQKHPDMSKVKPQ